MFQKILCKRFGSFLLLIFFEIDSVVNLVIFHIVFFSLSFVLNFLIVRFVVLLFSNFVFWVLLIFLVRLLLGNFVFWLLLIFLVCLLLDNFVFWLLSLFFVSDWLHFLLQIQNFRFTIKFFTFFATAKMHIYLFSSPHTSFALHDCVTDNTGMTEGEEVQTSKLSQILR